MSDVHVAKPHADDTRYDLRAKLYLARAHAKIGEAGAYDQALEALRLIAAGVDADGKPLDGLHPRTRVQAIRALLSSASSIAPRVHEVSGPEGGAINIDIGAPKTPEDEREFMARLSRAAREAESAVPPRPDPEPRGDS